MEAKSDFGNTALMTAIINKKWDVVKTLIKLKANVNTSNHLKQTTLHLAAYFGNVECINNLVAAGVDFETKLNGSTALMIAIGKAQWDAASALIKLKGNVHTTNETGRTPLIVAAGHGNGNVECIKCINNLVKSGSELEIKDINGNTALLYAISNKEWIAAVELIKLGANKNAKNEEGYTPRMLLAIGNEAEIEQLEKLGFKMTADDGKYAKEEYEQQFRRVQTIKEAGHILGFTCHISDIPSVGMSTRSGCLLLKKCLDSSALSCMFRPNDLASIQQAMNIAIGSVIEEKIYTPSSIQHKQFIENYTARKPTILPIQWSGHNLALIVWNDILVVCNRGEGNLKNFMSVFKIPDVKCTQNGIARFLETIMPTNQILSPEEVLQGIRNFVGDLEKPILTFFSQEQKHGTCNFVNLKSSFQPLLCFMKLLQPDASKPIDFAKFNSTFLEPYLNDGPLAKELQEIKGASRIQYKKFTKAMRDWEVDKLCAEFKTLSPTSDERKMYLEIFSAILDEHYGQSVNSGGHPRSPNKIKAEKSRMVLILNAMTSLGVDAQDSDKTAVMLSAARAGQWTAVQVLVEHGANVAALDTIALGTLLENRNSNGDTALMVAINKKKWDAASVLINLKAQVNTIDNDGLTPLILAALFENLTFITKLVNSGADLEFKTINNNTVLTMAILNEKWVAAAELINLKADVNTAKKDGQTPLILAANLGNVECINQLVTAGAKLDLKDILGNTALMTAVKSNQLGTVKVLIQLGADVNVKSLDGETALTLAKKNQNAEIIQILEHAIKTAADKQLLSESTLSPPAPVVWQQKGKPLDAEMSSAPAQVPPPPPKRPPPPPPTTQ